MRFRNTDETTGRPDWLVNFRAWVTRLSPAAIADLIDVLALELHERNVDGHDVLGEAAELVRGDHSARVRQLVDEFLPAPARPSSGASGGAPERMVGSV